MILLERVCGRVEQERVGSKVTTGNKNGFFDWLRGDNTREGYERGFSDGEHGKTAPESICRAYLRWRKGKK